MTLPLDTRFGNLILSWTSCSWRFNGVPFEGITAFKYPQKRERSVVYAGRRNGTPLGKTAGKYSADAITMRMLTETWDKLSTFLSTFGLGSYGDAEFVLVAQASELTALPPILPLTIICTGCTIDAVDHDRSEGNEALFTDLTIGALSITENGKALFSRARLI